MEVTTVETTEEVAAPEAGEKDEQVIDKVAELLKEKKYGEILYSADKVPFLDQQWLVNQAIAEGNAADVAFNLSKLDRVDKVESAQRAVDAGAADSVAAGIKELDSANLNKIMLKLLDSVEGRNAIYLRMKDYKHLDSDVALEALKHDENLVYQNLDSFDVMDERVTEAFLNSKISYVPNYHPEKFKFTPELKAEYAKLKSSPDYKSPIQ